MNRPNHVQRILLATAAGLCLLATAFATNANAQQGSTESFKLEGTARITCEDDSNPLIRDANESGKVTIEKRDITALVVINPFLSTVTVDGTTVSDTGHIRVILDLLGFPGVVPSQFDMFGFAYGKKATPGKNKGRFLVTGAGGPTPAFYWAEGSFKSKNPLDLKSGNMTLIAIDLEINGVFPCFLIVKLSTAGSRKDHQIFGTPLP